MKDNIVTVLSQLLGSFEEVPTYIGLCTDWEDSIDPLEVTRQAFRQFILKQSKEFIKAVHVNYLTELSGKVQESIYKLPELTFEDMRLKNQNPGLEDVNQAITKIYQEIQTLIKYSEECMHYIGVFKHAINYLDCWKRSINELVTDEDVCIECFGNQAARKRFSSKMTADVEAYISVLKIHQNVLTGMIEKTLRPRQNMLLRADSALRLLTKIAEMEKSPGWLSEDTNTPHKPRDISNFAVETV